MDVLDQKISEAQMLIPENYGESLINLTNACVFWCTN